MSHNELDIQQKEYEIYRELRVPPNNYIVVRLDGITFSKVTKRLGLAKPFDHGFMGKMHEVVKFIMEKVPDVVIGYTQSDEITLVFHRDTQYFKRRVEKFNSSLAALASAKLSILLGEPVSFDGRISVFPNKELMQSNLHWRIEDSVKNCRNLYTYWTLIREDGHSARSAQKMMLNQGSSWQNDYLHSKGVNFNDVNPMEKRGALFIREEYYKEGFNPKKKTMVITKRRRINCKQIDDVRKTSLSQQLGMAEAKIY